MPKKTRKQKQRSAARRQSPAIPGAAGLTAPAVDTVEETEADKTVDLEVPVIPAPVAGNAPAPSVSAAAQPAPMGARRRIERLSTPATPAQPTRQARGASSAVAMFEPLPPDDAAIPFDRVPYVPADLRRVAIMAGVMVVVIIIAAVIVSHIVT